MQTCRSSSKVTPPGWNLLALICMHLLKAPSGGRHPRELLNNDSVCNAERERWRTGHVEVLSPDDDSPFLLGDIAPGAARLAVDTNMFRAGRCPAEVGLFFKGDGSF